MGFPCGRLLHRAALRITPKDLGNPCQPTSNSGFRAQLGPQRRGLRPLIVQICNWQNRAPPACITLLCSRLTNTMASTCPPEAEIVDYSTAVGGRLFLTQTAPHDGQPGRHGRRESTTGRQAAWTSPAPDHSTLRPPCRRPSGRGGGESGRLSLQPCDSVSMLRRSVPASVHALANQLMAAAASRAGMPSHCPETDLREKEISYSTSRMLSTGEVARMRSLEISLATMTPLTGAPPARFSLTQPMYRRS